MAWALTVLDIASYVVGGAAILTILVIVFRKLRMVGSINTSIIPKNQNEKTLQKIAHVRLRRKFERASGFIGGFLRPLLERGYDSVRALVQKLIRVEKQLRSKAMHRASAPGTRAHFLQLRESAIDAENREDYVLAEKLFIEMISLDPSSVDTYKRLGDLYMMKKDFSSARETYMYIINLEKKKTARAPKGAPPLPGTELAGHYADIAEAHIGLEQWKEALTHIDEALRHEPNNPKYLDMSMTIALQLKDKERAKQVLARLYEVNAENQKLDEFARQVKEL